MAVSLNSQMPSGNGLSGTVSPFTYLFNNTSGTLLLVVAEVNVSTGGTSAISAISYNSVALTGPHVTQNWSSNACSVQIWYLLNPATGSNTVSITFTGGTHCISGAISFTGHDTVNPLRATTFQATGTTAPLGNECSVDVTGTTAGGYIVDGAGTGGAFNFSNTTGSWLLNVDGSTAGDNAGSSTAISPGGTQTMSYNILNDQWGIVAVEVQAASGAIKRLLGSLGVGK